MNLGGNTANHGCARRVLSVHQAPRLRSSLKIRGKDDGISCKHATTKELYEINPRSFNFRIYEFELYYWRYVQEDSTIDISQFAGYWPPLFLRLVSQHPPQLSKQCSVQMSLRAELKTSGLTIFPEGFFGMTSTNSTPPARCL